MDTMVNSYKKTKTYDSLYNETPAMWCFIINKDKGGKDDTFMKIVNNKLKKSSTFPPGPGNICLDNSQGCKNKDVKKIIRFQINQIMLDNFKEKDIPKATKIIRESSSAKIEVSGNINLMARP